MSRYNRSGSGRNTPLNNVYPNENYDESFDTSDAGNMTETSNGHRKSYVLEERNGAHNNNQPEPRSLPDNTKVLLAKISNSFDFDHDSLNSDMAGPPMLKPSLRDLNKPQNSTANRVLIPGSLPDLTHRQSKARDNLSVPNEKSMIKSYPPKDVLDDIQLAEQSQENIFGESGISKSTNRPFSHTTLRNNQPDFLYRTYSTQKNAMYTSPTRTVSKLSNSVEKTSRGSSRIDPLSPVYAVDSANNFVMYGRQDVANTSVKHSMDRTQYKGSIEKILDQVSATSADDSHLKATRDESFKGKDISQNELYETDTYQYEDNSGNDDQEINIFDNDSEGNGYELQDLKFSKSSPALHYGSFLDEPLSAQTVPILKTYHAPYNIPLLPNDAPLDLSAVGKPRNLHAVPFFSIIEEEIPSDQRKLLEILEYEMTKQDIEQEKANNKSNNNGFIHTVKTLLSKLFAQDNFREKNLWDSILRPEQIEEHRRKKNKEEGKIENNCLGENNTDMLPYNVDRSPVEDLTGFDTISLSRKEYPFAISERSLSLR